MLIGGVVQSCSRLLELVVACWSLLKTFRWSSCVKICDSEVDSKLWDGRLYPRKYVKPVGTAINMSTRPVSSKPSAQ